MDTQLILGAVLAIGSMISFLAAMAVGRIIAKIPARGEAEAHRAMVYDNLMTFFERVGLLLIIAAIIVTVVYVLSETTAQINSFL